MLAQPLLNMINSYLTFQGVKCNAKIKILQVLNPYFGMPELRIKGKNRVTMSLKWNVAD